MAPSGRDVVVEAEDGAVADAANQLGHRFGFALDNKVVESIGVCPSRRQEVRSARNCESDLCLGPRRLSILAPGRRSLPVGRAEARASAFRAGRLQKRSDKFALAPEAKAPLTLFASVLAIAAASIDIP